MATQKRQIGDLGEKLACQFLEKRGYKIIKQNWQIRQGEIDIIAQDKNGQFVFLEVKTRAGYSPELPESNIDFDKRRKLIKTVKQYLLHNDLVDQDFRIDTIAIELNQQTRRAKVRHLKNAVWA